MNRASRWKKGDGKSNFVPSQPTIYIPTFTTQNYFQTLITRRIPYPLLVDLEQLVMKPNPALTVASSSSGGRPRRQRRNTDQSPGVEMVVGDEDLLTEVLKCLPAKSLFRFRAVSHGWNRLIYHPQVLQSWKRPTSPSTIFIQRFTNTPNVKFYRISLTKINGSGGTISRSNPLQLQALDFILERKGITVLNSLNGLFVCSSARDSSSVIYTQPHYYLCNPTTKRYVEIPKPSACVRFPTDKFIIGMNLVFVQPDKYLVVAMCSDRPGIPGYCHIETYDPGTRTWKATSVSFNVSCPNCLCVYHGVLLDGVIYWIGIKTCNILFYVVKEERLMGLTLPQPSYEERLSYFGECGGQLCLIRLPESTSQNLNTLSHVPEFDVLVLEKDLSMWSVKYHIDLRVSSFFPFDMRLGNDDYLFTVISIVPGKRQGDSLLILYIPGEVVSFNLRDRTIEKICKLKLRPCDVSALQIHPWSIVHQCVETFLGP